MNYVFKKEKAIGIIVNINFKNGSYMLKIY